MPWTYSGTWEWRTYPANGQSGVDWGLVDALRATKDRWYPLVANGTLWIVRNRGVLTQATVTDRHTGFLRFVDAGSVVAPGFANGLMRTIFRIAGASGSGRQQLGMVCMLTHVDFHQQGTAYGLRLDGLQAASTWESLQLVHYPGPNGLRDNAEVLQSVPCMLAYTTPIMFELRWESAAEEDTLELWGSLGTLLDGADLTAVLHCSVTPAMLVANITEGLMVVFSTASLSDGYIDLRLESTTVEGSYVIEGV